MGLFDLATHGLFDDITGRRITNMALDTIADYITKAMQKIGVLASGESATADEVSDALDSFNVLISSWAADGLLTIGQTQENFVLTNGTRTYTIGTGLTFDTARPFTIKSGYIRDLSNQDHPLSTVSRQVYDDKPDKNTLGVPSILFYDPGATQQANRAGTIKLYPVPNANYTLFISSEKPLSMATGTSDVITFPPEYDRAIIYNLAIELAADWGRPISPTVVSIAAEAKAILENLNSQNRIIEATEHLAGSGSSRHPEQG